MKFNKSPRTLIQSISKGTARSQKKLSTTYVSLFLVLILFITSSFAWFTKKDKASVTSDVLTMDSSTGLSINEGESITNKIVINDFKLSEASSVDGRNMYFPITGTDTGIIDAQTANMLFREGNVGDRNVHYAYKNITIVGVTDPTNIYVKGFNVTIKDSAGNVVERFDGTTQIIDSAGDGIYDTQKVHNRCPIRIAFIEDSVDTPRVFDPTAVIQEHVHNSNAVSYIDQKGVAETQKTNNESFSEYMFTGATNEPLFQISHSEAIDLTMVVWMEGTDDEWDRYAGCSASVEVDLESNFSNMIPINFVDKTVGDNGSVDDGHWIEGGCVVVMTYKDSDGATKTAVMDKVDDDPPRWQAMLPRDITTDISFYRMSKEVETIYNSWHTYGGVNSQRSSTVVGWIRDKYNNKPLEEDRGTSMTYTALRGNGYGKVNENDGERDKKRLSPCVGYWDLTGTGGGSGGNTGGNTGGETTGSSVQVGVNLNITKTWIVDNIKDRDFTVWIEFASGDPVSMTISGENSDYATFSGELEIGTTIKSIGLKNSAGVFTHNLPLSSPQVISRSYNYNYKVSNDDKIVPNEFGAIANVIN